ncbi:hypothetical protein SAMN05216383_1082 [Prevotella sp. KH2C16]|nr:hypothetical protein SAMN05216383_1082 [Prevotella sp. KH2C16]
MILTGGIWYIFQWWFILVVVAAALLGHTLTWLARNWWCRHKGRKWRFKWANGPVSNAWSNIYWIEPPTRKDLTEFSEWYWRKKAIDFKNYASSG